jgi:hypothetical protein
MILLKWSYSKQAHPQPRNAFGGGTCTGNRRKVRHPTFERTASDRKRISYGLRAFNGIHNDRNLSRADRIDDMRRTFLDLIHCFDGNPGIPKIRGGSTRSNQREPALD